MDTESIQPPLNSAAEMGFLEHLGELRRRLIICLLAVGAAAAAAYFFSQPIFDFLCRPYFRAFTNNILIGTGPAEAFLLKLKVALFSGLILASPVIFHQLWLFVVPGLHAHERKLALPFILGTTVLFLAGMAFCYTSVFPFAFKFFHEQYVSIGITPTVRLSEHLSTMILGLLSFGLIFETPMLALVLGRLGVIDYRMLVASARYAIVVIFIISAILTPPDVLTQFLMAGPLLLLYGISILLVKLTGRRRGEARTQ